MTGGGQDALRQVAARRRRSLLAPGCRSVGGLQASLDLEAAEACRA